MNATAEQSLIAKIQTLSPEQVAEAEDFVEFLSAKMRRRAALAERRARQQGSGADRS